MRVVFKGYAWRLVLFTESYRAIEIWRNRCCLRNSVVLLLLLMVKVKVKFTLEQATKVQRYSCTLSLISALDGGCVANATPRSLNPWERPSRHCTGGWVGPRAGVDSCVKSRPPPGFDPRTVQPVARRYSDWVIPAHVLNGTSVYNSGTSAERFHQSLSLELLVILG